MDLSPLPTDSSSKLDILGHNCHTLGMNGAQVGIFKQANQIGFTCFLYWNREREKMLTM